MVAVNESISPMQLPSMSMSGPVEGPSSQQQTSSLPVPLTTYLTKFQREDMEDSTHNSEGIRIVPRPLLSILLLSTLVCVSLFLFVTPSSSSNGSAAASHTYAAQLPAMRKQHTECNNNTSTLHDPTITVATASSSFAWSGYFSAARYLALHADLRNANEEPASHFLSRGINERRVIELTNGLVGYFDPVGYEELHPQMRRLNMSAAQHYRQIGFSERLRVVVRPLPPLTMEPHTARGFDRTVKVIFDRPLFILTTGRTGTHVLLEQLARFPSVYTVGDESQLIYHGINSTRNTRRVPDSASWDQRRLRASDATPALCEEVRQRIARQLRGNDNLHPSTALQRDRCVEPRAEAPGSVDTCETDAFTGVIPESDFLQSVSVRYVDATPQNSFRVPFLRRCFPDAQFVWLYREPAATIASFMEMWLDSNAGALRFPESSVPTLNYTGHDGRPYEAPDRAYSVGPTSEMSWGDYLEAEEPSVQNASIALLCARRYTRMSQLVLQDLLAPQTSEVSLAPESESCASSRFISLNYQFLQHAFHAGFSTLCSFASLSDDCSVEAVEQLLGRSAQKKLSGSTVSAPQLGKWKKYEGHVRDAMQQTGQLATRLYHLSTAMSYPTLQQLKQTQRTLTTMRSSHATASFFRSFRDSIGSASTSNSALLPDFVLERATDLFRLNVGKPATSYLRPTLQAKQDAKSNSLQLVAYCQLELLTMIITVFVVAAAFTFGVPKSSY